MLCRVCIIVFACSAQTRMLAPKEIVNNAGDTLQICTTVYLKHPFKSVIGYILEEKLF